MTKYQVVAPNGEVFSRKTERTYTHAILADFDDAYAVIAFAGSYELAQKRAAEDKRDDPHRKNLIVEVTTGLNVTTEVLS
jgi:hypothetical protein